MILKLVNYEKIKGEDGANEVVNYIDKIMNASVKYDEASGMPIVKCTFENKAVISIDVPGVAYLMNDNGKTIDRIAAPGILVPEDGGICESLHDAIDEAVARSVN